MHNRLLLLIFTFMVVACQSSKDVDSPEVIQLDGILEQLPEIGTETQAAESTPTLSATQAVVTASVTPRTPSASRTPVPTSAHTATPPIVTPEGWQLTTDSGLTPNRKWFVFSRADTGQIGGFNVDGSGFTWFDLPPLADLRYWNQMATWRNWVAYVTGDDDTQNYELVIARFPEGEVIYRTSIFNSDLGEDYLRLDTLGTMDWSPDGERLVISISRYSSDTDLYIYRKSGNRLEQLTSEPGHAFLPRWSDDGEWINYREMAGTDEGSGAEIEKRRRVSVDGAVNEVYDIDYMFYGGCGGDGTNYEELTEPSGRSTAYVMVWYYDYDNEIYYDPGVYIRGEDEDESHLIFWTNWSAWGIEWNRELNLYIVSVEDEDFDGYIFFNRNGEIKYQFKEIEFSADGTMLAVQDIYDRLVIYEVDNGLREIWRIENPPVVSNFYWQPDGKGLIIEALGHLYHVHLLRSEVNLIARDLAGEFYIRNGYWIAQSP